jgi:hypothetical protein
VHASVMYFSIVDAMTSRALRTRDFVRRRRL